MGRLDWIREHFCIGPDSKYFGLYNLSKLIKLPMKKRKPVMTTCKQAAKVVFSRSVRAGKPLKQVKVIAAKPDDLSSSPRIHMLEGEN